ncbi:hypothetical protein B0O80DRAFT_169683 [Mortierella sp. GBAus27b]|nr:hypothetical protein BGX31_000554 [Mortierella sp. GBA43]KAI8349090.1 hypothetical protein B0O80DRAFT_169683 [Mortierella sp. GBAus27b]
MAYSADEESVQTLYNRLTKETVKIPVMNDRGTKQSVVLWSDIQSSFENVTSIRIGEILVPFMKDENFNELVPKRIAHHPGIVLDVVVAKTHPPDPFGGAGGSGGVGGAGGGRMMGVGESMAAAHHIKDAIGTDTMDVPLSSNRSQDHNRNLSIRLSSGSNADTHSPTSNFAIFAATKINTSDSNRLSVNRE